MNTTATATPGRVVPLHSSTLREAEKLMREQDEQRKRAREKIPTNYEARDAQLRRSILDKGDLDIKLALSTDESVKINPIQFFLLRVLKHVRRIFGVR
jgi:hypothetical protein